MIHATIQLYTAAIQQSPSLHHEFLSSRAKYIKLKNENPSLVLRGKNDLMPARVVNLRQTQDL